MKNLQPFKIVIKILVYATNSTTLKILIVFHTLIDFQILLLVSQSVSMITRLLGLGYLGFVNFFVSFGLFH